MIWNGNVDSASHVALTFMVAAARLTKLVASKNYLIITCHHLSSTDSIKGLVIRKLPRSPGPGPGQVIGPPVLSDGT